MCIWYNLKSQLFLLFSLFLLLFMDLIALFGIIHGSHCTFWYYSWVSLYYFSYFLDLSTVLSIKNFQFQLNNLFPIRLKYSTINYSSLILLQNSFTHIVVVYLERYIYSIVSKRREWWYHQKNNNNAPEKMVKFDDSMHARNFWQPIEEFIFC